MKALTDSHDPARPEWTCTATGHPWPCTVARTALLAQFANDRRGLILHLGARLADAIDDFAAQTHGDVPPGLTDRFMGWVPELPEEPAEREGAGAPPERA